MSKTPKFSHEKIILVCTEILFSIIFGIMSSDINTNEALGLTDQDLSEFSQNDILFYDPSDCITVSSSGTLSASGDYAKVLQAKNANESVFNVDSGSKWDASWSDGDKAGMKKLLENYGDLAYQLGNAVGAPWVAIIVQMKYEDPMSCCGANNFWGNGCDANHSSYCGASTIQGKNLGEGFVQYGETLSSDWYSSVRGISDPKEYLEKLGPLWVQGDPNGAGYTSIEYMKDSIDSLQSYIDSSEGQAIVKTFGNYSGSSSSSSSSSLSSNSESSQSISGDDIIWIGDSDSSTAGEALLEETFPGIKNGGYGPTFNTSTSYIQSCKFIDQDGCGSQPNDSGLEILKRIINEGKMRKYLVFALGGNGGWEQSTMDKFLNLVGEDTKIVLTTTKYRKGDYTESNNLVKKIAEEHSNIYVADIAANYKDEYIDSSDIEFTEEGAKMFVQTIKDALLSAGGSCIDGGTIAAKAKELAWPEDNADKAKSNPTTSFTEASGDVGTDGTDDCLTFVKTVILSSGADVSSELTSDSTKKEIGFTEYLKGSGKWKEITADKTSDLKPGDILVSAVEGVGYNHTFVYLGNNEVASANKGIHYGRIGSLENEWCSEWGGNTAFKCVDNPFQVFRIVDSGCGDKCTTYEGEYPEYLQWEEPWGSVPYSTGTIARSGCGAASMAMLATVATGQDIYPNDIADLLGDQYYDSVSLHELDPKVGEHYGFEVIKDDSSSVEETKTKFRKYLNDGYMIHFTGAGCYPGFEYGGACSEGHIIGLFSIEGNDTVMQANPAYGGNQESSLDDVAKAKTLSAFTAIKGGSGNGKNTCAGLCNGTGSNVSVSMDGLTEEQAQKIADYYNSNQVTSSNFMDGVIPSDYGKVNCVSFSYWFVSAFTDAPEKGGSSAIIGDGSYIADTGLPSIGWETGNDPTPYSVFGGAGSSAWSHTGVVVGTTSDGNYLTIEAAYGQYDARVMSKPASYFASGVGILAYPGSHFTPNEGHLGNKSIKEIIGS